MGVVTNELENVQVESGGCSASSFGLLSYGVVAEGGLDHVVRHHKLRQGQGVADEIGFVAVSEVPDVFSQVRRFRDEIPQQVLDAGGRIVIQVAL